MKSFGISALVLAAPLAIFAQVPVNGLFGFGSGTTAKPSTTTCAALKAAVLIKTPAVIRITETLTGCGIVDIETNDKSILGGSAGAGFKDSGIRVRKAGNVISCNLIFNTTHGPDVRRDVGKVFVRSLKTHAHFESPVSPRDTRLDAVLAAKILVTSG